MHFFRKNRLLLLSLLSGVLFALSWPSGGVPLLIFVAFIPLLIVEEHIKTHQEDYHRYSVLFYAWLAFAVFNGLTTWWIFFASFPGVLMAVFLNSLFMAIPFYLMHLARRILPGNQGVVSLVIFWLSFEFLHLDWDLSWSWLNLGNVFATMPRWVQWYEYTGTLGGTTWIIIMNICFYALYRAYRQPLETITVQRNIASGEGEEAKQKKQMEIYLKNVQQFQLIKRRAFTGLATFFFLVVPPVISLVIWNRYDMPEETTEVVIVQPGRDPYLDPRGEDQVKQWSDSLILLADDKITPSTRFVVAPEASLPGTFWLNRPESHYGYNALSEHVQKHDSLAWVIGSMMYRQYEHDETPSATARQFRNSDSWYDAYNAALYLDSDGTMDTYFKSKLVPGIERMPFARLLKPVGKLVEYFGGTAGSMGVQNDREVFTGMDGTRVAPVICYESIYGEYLNRYVIKGAELIFIVTNDGWWRDTPGYRQHNQYARLRAIETRRSIARAAKTGISGFIDPMGRFYQQTQWWEADVLREQIPKNDKITFYVRSGDFLGRLALFLLILLLLYMISQAIIRKRSGALKQK